MFQGQTVSDLKKKKVKKDKFGLTAEPLTLSSWHRNDD